MTTRRPWPGGGPDTRDDLAARPDPLDLVDLQDLVDRVEELVRHLGRLGDDLAVGLRGLAWRGVARDRVGDLLAARLQELSVVGDRLGRAAHDLLDRADGAGP